MFCGKYKKLYEIFCCSWYIIPKKRDIPLSVTVFSLAASRRPSHSLETNTDYNPWCSSKREVLTKSLLHSLHRKTISWNWWNMPLSVTMTIQARIHCKDRKRKTPSSGIQQGGRQSLGGHITIMTIRIGVNALKRTFWNIYLPRGIEASL